MKKMTQTIKLSRRLGLLILFSLFLSYSKADIWNITVNHSGLNGFPDTWTEEPTDITPIFTSTKAEIRVTGRWIDLTSQILLVALDGQSATNIAIAKKGNSSFGNDYPWVSFIIERNLTGRYRVELSRPGGSDNFLIRFYLKPNINSISFLNRSGQPTYLSAFPINTDIRVRLSGVRLTNVQLDTGTNYTIINQNFVPNTSEIKEVIIQVPIELNEIKLPETNFTITIAGHRFKLSNFTSFGENNLFRTYNKPNLVIQGPLVNWYKKLTSASGTCLINTNQCLMIPDPARCVTPFGVPAPTQTTPVTQKIVSLPAPSISIKNDSYAPIFTTFTVEFRFGLNVLQTVTISKMIAQEVRTITYTRPESRKLLYRSITCPYCYEDPGAPYDWQDPSTITVIIDPSNSITEKTETDNSRTFQ